MPVVIVDSASGLVRVHQEAVAVRLRVTLSAVQRIVFGRVEGADTRVEEAAEDLPRSSVES